MSFREALRKQAINITGAAIIVPSVIAGIFYFIGWMDNTYASDADVKIIQSQQKEQGHKFDLWIYDQRQEKLEHQIEVTGDAIFDLKRRIAVGNPTENDLRQLDRLERRLKRYEDRLDNLGPPPSRSSPTQ